MMNCENVKKVTATSLTLYHYCAMMTSRHCQELFRNVIKKCNSQYETMWLEKPTFTATLQNVLKGKNISVHAVTGK